MQMCEGAGDGVGVTLRSGCGCGCARAPVNTLLSALQIRGGEGGDGGRTQRTIGRSAASRIRRARVRLQTLYGDFFDCVSAAVFFLRDYCSFSDFGTFSFSWSFLTVHCCNAVTFRFSAS